MRAEDTLQYMADFYPDIFPTRKHCLNQLFCVIGNGYKWINGELVDEDNKYEKRYKLRKPIKKAEFKNEENWYKMNKYYTALKAYDQDCKFPMQYDFEWYPVDEKYSKLFNYPTDIKEDWMSLIEECKRMLFEDGIGINNIDYEW